MRWIRSAAHYVGGLVDYQQRVTQTYATSSVMSVTALSAGWSDGTIPQQCFSILLGHDDQGNPPVLNKFRTFSATGLTTINSLATTLPIGTSAPCPAVGCAAGAAACWVIVDANGTLNNADGAAGATRPMLLSEWSTAITTGHQLQLMALDPTANYKLANSISLGTALANVSDIWGPNGTAGFVPIGNILSGGFTGTFDGRYNTIDGLKVASTNSGVNSIGLFGALYGSVSNLTLSNVSIAANPNVGLPGQFVGTLAGLNVGTISNVSVIATGDFTNTLAGGTSVGVSAGGLVGQNFGTISASSAAVNVTLGDGTNCLNVSSCAGGLNMAGGLAGTNYGTVQQSYATGTVGGGDWSLIGGLVGGGTGSVTNSYATGNVSGGANSFVGGLMGQAGFGCVGDCVPGISSIASAYATGSVTVTGLSSFAGGLVGWQGAGSTITDSQAFGAVTSSANGSPQSASFTGAAGGLVGQNYGTVQGSTTPTLASACAQGAAFSCASGAVSVGSLGQAGGLVGWNDGILVNVLATGAVTGGAGFAPDQQGNNFQTQLGGLVGSNQGKIDFAFATGAVGTAGVANLQVGGLLGSASA